MPQTLEQQLEEVQTAISRAQRAIETTSGDKTLKRSQLQPLYDRERDLLARINRKNGGRRIRYGVPV